MPPPPGPAPREAVAPARRIGRRLRAAARAGVVAALALAALALALLAACSGPASREEPAVDPVVAGKLDARLRRLAASSPDTTIGVLVRTRVPVGAAEREALTRAGLDVGTVAGDIVTGRLRAGVAPDLARLPFVVYVEAAGVLKPSRSPHPPGPDQPLE